MDTKKGLLVKGNHLWKKEIEDLLIWKEGFYIKEGSKLRDRVCSKTKCSMLLLEGRILYLDLVVLGRSCLALARPQEDAELGFLTQQLGPKL